jgi:hypothetical protein
VSGAIGAGAMSTAAVAFGVGRERWARGAGHLFAIVVDVLGAAADDALRAALERLGA